MTIQGKIRQYKTLVEALHPGKGKSRKQLMLRLEAEGFLVSPRTFDRLMEELRFQFGISITYDPRKNHYVIDDKSHAALDGFINFCKAGELAEFTQSLLAAPSATFRQVSFGNGHSLLGIQWLQPLLQAIANRLPLRIQYQNFQKGSVKTIVLQPYMLREYLHRWYLLGLQPESAEQKLLALERITALETLPEPFEIKDEFPFEDIFRQVVGLSPAGEPEKVLLRAYPPLDKFLVAYPLHPSQQLVRETKDYTEFSWQLVVNRELEQWILQQGGEAEVLEPKSLRKSVRNQLRQALQYYK